LLRVTKPGRLTCCHVAQIAAMLVRDGYIGLKDFRGKTIAAFIKAGWIHHGEICIQKNPQALRDGSKVLTLKGWLPIEQIQTGDFVAGESGKFVEVTAIYPYKNRQMYKVTFSDGAQIDCDAEHLWTVQTIGLKRVDSWINKTTKELYKNLQTPSGYNRYEIPISKEIEYKQDIKDLPLSPYLVGVLLGDGLISSRGTVGVCTDHEIVNKLNLPPGCKITQQKNTEKGNNTVATYYITHEKWHENPVLNSLRELGLHGKRAWEKFIPDKYLVASIKDRKALLQGLLDTDGTIKKNRAIVYTTTSKQLAENITTLVQSLGGLVITRIESSPKYSYKGETRIGREQYLLTIQLNIKWNPFTLKRKADRWEIRKYQIRRSIKNIELVGKSNCTCITVNSKSGLFITENFVVTHNCQAIRTHSKGLLFAQLRKDSSWLHPALADFVLLFRKPGENEVPIKPDITNEEWIQWAHPIWHDIRETNTLNTKAARSEADERHICPLQLQVIERCIKLWSNPGEIILSPFMGIGSEIYEALRLKRCAIGIELKNSYFQESCKNAKRALEVQNISKGFFKK
jgi:hypothetical protein